MQIASTPLVDLPIGLNNHSITLLLMNACSVNGASLVWHVSYSSTMHNNLFCAFHDLHHCVKLGKNIMIFLSCRRYLNTFEYHGPYRIKLKPRWLICCLPFFLAFLLLTCSLNRKIHIFFIGYLILHPVTSALGLYIYLCNVHLLGRVMQSTWRSVRQDMFESSLTPSCDSGHLREEWTEEVRQEQ